MTIHALSELGPPARLQVAQIGHHVPHPHIPTLKISLNDVRHVGEFSYQWHCLIARKHHHRKPIKRYLKALGENRRIQERKRNGNPQNENDDALVTL